MINISFTAADISIDEIRSCQCLPTRSKPTKKWDDPLFLFFSPSRERSKCRSIALNFYIIEENEKQKKKIKNPSFLRKKLGMWDLFNGREALSPCSLCLLDSSRRRNSRGSSTGSASYRILGLFASATIYRNWIRMDFKHEFLKLTAGHLPDKVFSCGILTHFVFVSSRKHVYQIW